jgi:antitoxin component of MazEF toxin-antitoxin module
MAGVTRKADKNGRVLLFPDFAGQELILERVGEDEVRLKKAKPLRRRRKYTLAELLAQVTPESIHPEVDFGRPLGKEVW